jgi:hypothetical protein
MKRTLKAVVLLTAALVVVLGVVFNIAHANGTIEWTGHGKEKLPCSGGAHWVLAPAFGIDSATVVVNGTSYTMTQNGQGSWSAFSIGPLGLNTTASVTFTGPGDSSDNLQLSHCVAAPGAPPTVG